MGEVVTGAWRRAIKCPCGKIWHTFHTRFWGWRHFAPDEVCPTCGGAATKMIKIISRPVYEVLRRKILKDKKVYIKHEVKEQQ